MGEVLVQRNPKGVVVRVSVAVHLVDVAERASRLWCGALRRQNGTRGRKGWEGPRRTVNAIRNERLIDILIQLEVRALHSNVSNGEAHAGGQLTVDRSEEHTSELQSRLHLVCRLLLEKKKKNDIHYTTKKLFSPYLIVTKMSVTIRLVTV